MNYSIEAAKQALDSIDLNILRLISDDLRLGDKDSIQDAIADIKAAKKFLAEAETE